jgi:hypothetical protein
MNDEVDEIQDIYDKVEKNFESRTKDIQIKYANYLKNLTILQVKMGIHLSEFCREQIDRIEILSEGPGPVYIKQLKEGKLTSKHDLEFKNSEEFGIYDKFYTYYLDPANQDKYLRQVYGDKRVDELLKRLRDGPFVRRTKEQIKEDEEYEYVGPILGDMATAMYEDYEMCYDKHDNGWEDFLDYTESQPLKVDYENLECLDKCEYEHEEDPAAFEKCANDCLNNTLLKMYAVIDDLDKRAKEFEPIVAHIDLEELMNKKI